MSNKKKSIKNKDELESWLQIPPERNGNLINAIPQNGQCRRDLSTGDVPDSSLEQGTTATHPEGGWGWVVCAASCWTNGIVFGVINTFGFLYKKMVIVYGEDDPTIAFKTAWVGSLCTGMTFFMSPVASVMTDKLGIQKTSMIGAVLAFMGILSSSFIKKLEFFYLTYGLLMGVGFSLVYNPSLVILGHYFKQKIGLVNGIVTVGSSLFSVPLTFLLPYVLDEIGIAWSMRILAGFVAVLLVCPFIWKPMVHVHQKPKDYGDVDFFSAESIYLQVSGRCNDCCSFVRRFVNVRIWKKRTYVIWAIAVPLSLLGYFIMFIHLVNYSDKKFKDTGPDGGGKYLMMTITVTSGFCRLLFGKVSDFKRFNRVRMHQVSCALMGLVTICIPFAEQFWGLVVICALFGIGDGCFVCLLGPIAFDIVGHKGASQALGFVLGLASIPVMAGPPLAGLIYDLVGDYEIVFYVAGCPPIIGAFIMFFMPQIQQHFPHMTEAEVVAMEPDLGTEDVYRQNYKDPEGIWHMAGSKYIGLDEPPPKTKSRTNGFGKLLTPANATNEKYLSVPPINGHQKKLNETPTKPETVELLEARESVL